MKIKSSLMPAAVGLCLLASPSLMAENQADFNRVIPHPVAVTTADGAFMFTSASRICYPAGNALLKSNAGMLAGYIKKLTGATLAVTDDAPRDGDIILQLNPAVLAPEGYQIDVTPKNLTITSSTPNGDFYGIQTIRKSLLADAEQDGVALFPAGRVVDHPRFGYRGAHLDVARHFFPLDSVKRFIDIIALHNVNKFHWHLTDDQGWRVEIRKRPELTVAGAVRKGTAIGRDLSSSDSIPYGGFYTQDEIRELVDYAARHYIEVIPEIDMPGHMQAALAAYPYLGCKGDGYDVWQSWGVSPEVLCPGNDSVYVFVEDVLSEIMELFPGKYIHIGGDECPKERWEKCPKCQALADSLGLYTDSVSTREQKLQTAFMSRAVDFIEKHGRRAIGWDEILEGGLSGDVAVMSWRGTEGAADAARQGHDAILTPTDYCYFNFYQSADTDNEPLAIGGYVPLTKVYSFEPVAKELTPEQAGHILGAQSNLWTEYISEFWGLEYMELPRLAALSEVQWCAPDAKDFNRFLAALPTMQRHYDSEGYKYGRHLYNPLISMAPDPEGKGMDVTINTVAPAPIRYTLDGSTPTVKSKLYTGPFTVNKTATVKAVSFPEGGRSREASMPLSVHKGFMKKVVFNVEPNCYGSPEGDSLVLNGLRGNLTFSSGQWVGIHDKDVEAVVDLGEPEEVSKVGVGILIDTSNWIFSPREVEVEGSLNGTDYQSLGKREIPVLEKDTKGSPLLEFSFPPLRLQYIRIKARPTQAIPAWHPGRGNSTFIFFDEFIIE